MKTNPGGQLSPDDVVGRAELIERVWSCLSTRSVVLTAERRMGKTSVLKKMLAEPKIPFLPVYRDLEPIRSPEEFAEVVLHDAEAYLSRSQKAAVKARRLLSELEGAQLAGLKVPAGRTMKWREVLMATFDDLAESQPEHTLLFFWDEVPLMLYNVANHLGPETAMEILDTLRAIRQQYANIRMVFTGSIGLHIVVGVLRQAGYANYPTNDMQTIAVEPLSPEDATALAVDLLIGEGLVAARVAEPIAKRICAQVDRIPFLIHHVVDQLTRASQVDEETVDLTIVNCLEDPSDPWHLTYYRERIDTYYPLAQRACALAILDEVAKAGTTPVSELLNRIQALGVSRDQEAARAIISLLERDHYLRRTGTDISFSIGLVRRFWLSHRSL